MHQVNWIKPVLICGTPLHWAAMSGNLQMFKALLDAGADPSVRTLMESMGPFKGYTALDIFIARFGADSAARLSASPQRFLPAYVARDGVRPT